MMPMTPAQAVRTAGERRREGRGGSVQAAWVALLALLLAACGTPPAEREPAPSELHQRIEPPTDVEPRTLYWPTFPCTQCHENGVTNPEQRKLVKFHTMRNELHHGDAPGWCYRCHSSNNRNMLIADGKEVTFDEGYKLCGSCHGDKLRDWKRSVHGFVKGHWNGKRTRRSCTGCHNPHGPAFEPMEALPPPPMPHTHEGEPAQAHNEH